MKNKVLIKLIVPLVDLEFDVFIPVNEVIFKIKKLFLRSINDITLSNLDEGSDYVLLNKDSCRIYSNNDIIINTDIRNGTELILLKK